MGSAAGIRVHTTISRVPAKSRSGPTVEGSVGRLEGRNRECRDGIKDVAERPIGLEVACDLS